MSIALAGGFAALFASIIAAFSGGGLSLILFPILLSITEHPYVSLLAVSKLSAAIMSVTSAKIHATKVDLNWRFLSFVGGAQILGTAIGTYFVQYRFHEALFYSMLGWTVLLTAMYLFFAKKVGLGEEATRPITHRVYIEAGIFCSVVSILNGIFGGTGIFVTLFFVVVLKMSLLESMAYVMPSFAIVNVVQAGYLLGTEWVEWKLALFVVIGSLIGGWCGTHLQYLKGNLAIKRAAILVMFLIGCKTLWF